MMDVSFNRKAAAVFSVIPFGGHTAEKPDCGKIRRRQNPTWQHLLNHHRPIAKSFCRGRLKRQRLNSCQLLVYKSLQSRTVFQTHGEKEREKKNWNKHRAVRLLRRGGMVYICIYGTVICREGNLIISKTNIPSWQK